ncbi:hydroxymethylglutaryl-CoA reductase, degradative [Candidatus Babeliales bacterium]|nr:hydroxymethylglutaryl-CoA reductase, degradative [Candidatus Babeliales bacterium]
MKNRCSRFPAFYKKSVEERLQHVQAFADLTNQEVQALQSGASLAISHAQKMSENVVSVMSFPLSIATNFMVNGNDYLIPMVTEEPSVVAAASYGAKLARVAGGFTAHGGFPLMTGQILLASVPDCYKALQALNAHKNELLSYANQADPVLLEHGGGAVDVVGHELLINNELCLSIKLSVNVGNAMGANIVNTMAERIAPLIQKMCGGQVRLCIVSNFSPERVVRVAATWKQEMLGQPTIDAMVQASAFAAADSYRAATHNKGIMNGVVAVCLATGNDTRAAEAGVHSYAARTGSYQPLSWYEKNEAGDLVGHVEMPLAVATVGGITKSHPTACLALKILGVATAQELAGVVGAVGLAQNFAALRALVTEGIQYGHMRLHSQNIAITAGATGAAIEAVASCMVLEKNISVARARALLAEGFQ